MIPIDWRDMARIISSYPGEVWIWVRSEKFCIFPADDHVCTTWGGENTPKWLNIDSSIGECDIQIPSIKKITVKTRYNITLEERTGVLNRF